MQLETLDPPVRDYVNDYIKEIETRYEQHIKELRDKYEKSIKEYKEYEYKYLEIKEQYDLLVYKRFARSAEQLLEDAKQQLLFAEEAKEPDAAEEKPEAFQTVKSFSRKKGGRKPLSAHLQRREKIIDIPESEKTCACGAELTRIGEETAD